MLLMGAGEGKKEEVAGEVAAVVCGWPNERREGASNLLCCECVATKGRGKQNKCTHKLVAPLTLVQNLYRVKCEISRTVTRISFCSQVWAQ